MGGEKGKDGKNDTGSTHIAIGELKNTERSELDIEVEDSSC